MFLRMRIYLASMEMQGPKLVQILSKNTRQKEYEMNIWMNEKNQEIDKWIQFDKCMQEVIEFIPKSRRICYASVRINWRIAIQCNILHECYIKEHVSLFLQLPRVLQSLIWSKMDSTLNQIPIINTYEEILCRMAKNLNKQQRENMSRKSKTKLEKNYIKKLKKIQAIRENQTREGFYYDVPLDPVLYFVRIKK